MSSQILQVKSLAFSNPYQFGIESATSHLFLRSSTIDLSSIAPTSVVIKLLAVPVNPVDFLVLAGKYPVKPKFKIHDLSIAGFDGAAEVVAVGKFVTKVKVGDKILPRSHGLGTWRTHAVLDENDVVVLPNGVDPRFAALIKMGFAPAFFLLEDMRKLNPGDFIIMNAGTSVIAQAVVRFAKLKGVKTILVVRDREQGKDLIRDGRQTKLEDLKKTSGADMIVTESQMAHSMQLKDNIVLAIDCVFGKSGHNLVRNLCVGGTYVMMGFMSRNDSDYNPVADFKIDETNIFYKAIEFKNFRLSRCLEKRTTQNIEHMVAWFCELQRKGILTAFDIEVNDWKQGTSEEVLLQVVGKAEDKSVGGKKQLFVMS